MQTEHRDALLKKKNLKSIRKHLGDQKLLLCHKMQRSTRSWTSKTSETKISGLRANVMARCEKRGRNNQQPGSGYFLVLPRCQTPYGQKNTFLGSAKEFSHSTETESENQKAAQIARASHLGSLGKTLMLEFHPWSMESEPPADRRLDGQQRWSHSGKDESGDT